MLLTHREHALKRPDTYIDSVEIRTQLAWVWENDTLVHRETSFVPGLVKLFDEVIVNASDHRQNHIKEVKHIQVHLDQATGRISVKNDGPGIRIEMHKASGLMLPQLIFGELRTSSNYDDTDERVTGGRNGYGAKLANIFSREFTVETVDGNKSKRYTQVWTNNMKDCAPATIEKVSKSTKPYTKISFIPDYRYFKLSGLDNDHMAMMAKRTLDIAGCNDKLKVSLNGVPFGVDGFEDYVKMFFRSAFPDLCHVDEDPEEDSDVIDEDSTKKKKKKPAKKAPEDKYIAYAKVSDRFEVAVTQTPSGAFEQISFVNSINTYAGGSHVDCVADQLMKPIQDEVMKKSKLGKDEKPPSKGQVKSRIWLFVRSLVINPSFNSQAKSVLGTTSSSFAMDCQIAPAFLKKIVKLPLLADIVDLAIVNRSKELKKSDGTKKARVRGIPKLDDANHAGQGKKAQQCTLILTEGDSAKTLAVAGLEIVGRDKYGVFPLRGKMLNVRGAKAKQIAENTEISYIKQIMGLKQGVDYSDDANFARLRYGHIMIMVDQDHDGSHIKGLVINFIHRFWPTLLKRRGFLVEFITPIVVAKRGTGRNQRSDTFYTIPEYEAWRDALSQTDKRGLAVRYYKTDKRGLAVRYYKGLGTSTPAEGRAYFRALTSNKKLFKFDHQTDRSIELAFAKGVGAAAARKGWLANTDPNVYLDQSAKQISYSDFVNKELVLFSIADNLRSIPNIMDGLKTGQRKIIFCCFKRNLTTSIKVAQFSGIKVAQFSGYVSEHASYHHGEQSLGGAIVGMAQTFVGSNNLNLLVPDGQFGTRLHGGKDAASPRYIHTRLNPLTRLVFPAADDPLLHYLNDDGQSIEPEYYMPIIPMVLANGADGIGTGYATSIPTYDVSDLIRAVRRRLLGRSTVEEATDMHPSWNKWTGVSTAKRNKKGQVSGFYVKCLI
ncbi:DNA topoisomerase II, eukaryotic-type [Kipferlia bialata]|uniref:DNA topoisomerase 2 n=1 Tax=Kipferlia bialata TaxID=797122 RepID=A0A9K3GGM1_9EUKA|nr:DNA topoisomerase II, eukaryotic-type [Kipferlia bialata]|eukprot:g2421.t1